MGVSFDSPDEKSGQAAQDDNGEDHDGLCIIFRNSGCALSVRAESKTDHRVLFVANAWESPSTLPMKNRDRLLRMT